MIGAIMSHLKEYIKAAYVTIGGWPVLALVILGLMIAGLPS
jgi:hypothetical protein